MSNFPPDGNLQPPAPQHENAVTCLTCGTRIVSRSRHDFVSCKCPPESGTQVAVDGGNAYGRRVVGHLARWREEDGTEWPAKPEEIINLNNFSGPEEEESTPEEFMELVRAEFDINFDLAATQANKKADAYLGPDHPDPRRRDALEANWVELSPDLSQKWAWLNPPYGRWTARWVKRAYDFAQLGMKILLLVPVKTDTHWWHDYILGAREIRFLQGRLSFVRNAPQTSDNDDEGNGAKRGTGRFASALVIFDGPMSEGWRPDVRWWDWRQELEQRQRRQTESTIAGTKGVSGSGESQPTNRADGGHLPGPQRPRRTHRTRIPAPVHPQRNAVPPDPKGSAGKAGK